MNFYNDFIRSREVEAGEGIVHRWVQFAIAAAGPVLASCAPAPSEFRRPAL